MAKNVKINGVSYNNVPYVTIPLADDSGDAKFMDTTDATAAATDLRQGETAYINDTLVTGTVAEQSADTVAVSGKNITVPAGIYDTQVEKAVADGAVTPNSDVTSSLLGDEETDYAVVITPKATVGTAGWVESVTDGAAVTKYIQVETKTVEPSMESQTVEPTEGKLLEAVTVNPVVMTGTATAADVMQGKTFYNTNLEIVTGTATVPVVGQDPESKALEIA